MVCYRHAALLGVEVYRRRAGRRILNTPLSEPTEIRHLLEDLHNSPSVHFATALTQYRNDAKVKDLFTATLMTVTEIARAAKESDEARIRAAGEVGISTGIVQFFLNLKASLTSSVEVGESLITTIERKFQGPWRMALAEAALQRNERIADVVKGGGHPISKPYVRFCNIFQAFPPVPDDELEQELTRVLGHEAATAIVERKKLDERGHPNITQFVYATDDPFLMASILFAPPNPEFKIEGDSWACYPANPDWDRICFGVLRDKVKGVTFVDLYYVLDVPLE